jgi:hypothetical protein
MMAEEPDDDLLSPEQIAAEIEAAGITLTKQDLQAMLAAAKTGAKTEAREVEIFPLKPMLPLHVSYETGRRACARGELRAEKHGGDWFTTKADVAAWLMTSGRWFETEGAVQTWHAGIAGLQRWWKP